MDTINPPVKTTLKLVDEKLRFKAKNENDIVDPIIIDYQPPLGTGEGYNSLELILISLSSCVGSVFVNLLRKKRKDVKAFDIEMEGDRKTEHPKGFYRIKMTINLKSSNITLEDMEKTLLLAEDYCAVKAMLKDDIEIVLKCNLIQD